MALPTSRPITQEYGWTPYALSGAYGGLIHNGIDFGCWYEQYFSPALQLTLESQAWDNSGFGYLVIAKDNLGYRHFFGHNSQFIHPNGTVLALGIPVAISGSSGNSTAGHLHWSIQLPGYSGYNGFINPRNWPGFNVEGGTVDVSEKKDLIDEVYLRVLGRGADATALRDRLPQNRAQIEADLFASDEYPQRLRDGVKALDGSTLPDSLIDSNRKARTTVPMFLFYYARDRLSESGSDKLSKAKSKAQEIINL